MTNPCIDFDLENITLLRGGHGERFTGAVCMVECANVAAACIPELREKYGKAKFMDDHPSISPVVRSFSISWNDGLNDEDRNRLLKPRVLQILGTKTTPQDEEARAWMATDWLARVATPAWLRLAGLTKEAQAIEATARIVDAVTATAAQPALDAARTSAAAARAAAWAAAWAAARDAAWAAARAAARDAAWAAARGGATAAARDAAGDAARAAAGAAAWDAARAAARAAAGAAAGAAARAAARAAAWAAAWAAARDAAWEAARDAARDAAWAAAWDAARAAAWAAARDAAWAAARKSLRPTVVALQESAAALLDAMCAVGREQKAAA
jgi:hypothetical protein